MSRLGGWWSEESVEADWKLRGFEPISQEIQFDGGQTDGGVAGERELVWSGLGDIRPAQARFRSKGLQPKQTRRAGRQLGFMRRRTRKLSHVKPLLDPRAGDFPIVIDQIGLTQGGRQLDEQRARSRHIRHAAA